MTQTPDTPAPARRPSLVEVTDGIAWLRLNRPDAMNSLDNALKDALVAALREVGDDPAVRCVVLTGTGRAFCVGQDLKEHVRSLGDPDLDARDDRDRPLQPDRHRALDDEQAGRRRAQRRGRRRGDELRARVRLPGRVGPGRAQHRRSPASRSRATRAPRGRCPGSSGRPAPRSCCSCRAPCRRRGPRARPRDEGRAGRGARGSRARAGPHPRRRPDAGLRLDPARRGLLRGRRPRRLRWPTRPS